MAVPVDSTGNLSDLKVPSASRPVARWEGDDRVGVTLTLGLGICSCARHDGDSGLLLTVTGSSTASGSRASPAAAFCWIHPVQDFKNRLHKGYSKRLLLHHLSPCYSMILLTVLAMPMNYVVDLSD
jgi:hypothetical protein